MRAPVVLWRTRVFRSAKRRKPELGFRRVRVLGFEQQRPVGLGYSGPLHGLAELIRPPHSLRGPARRCRARGGSGRRLRGANLRGCIWPNRVTANREVHVHSLGASRHSRSCAITARRPASVCALK
jgi:hypothetical protein